MTIDLAQFGIALGKALEKAEEDNNQLIKANEALQARLDVFERFIGLTGQYHELLAYVSFNEDEDNKAAQQIIKECLFDVSHSLD